MHVPYVCALTLLPCSLEDGPTGQTYIPCRQGLADGHKLHYIPSDVGLKDYANNPSITGLTFAQDGQTLAAACWNGDVYICMGSDQEYGQLNRRRALFAKDPALVRRGTPSNVAEGQRQKCVMRHHAHAQRLSTCVSARLRVRARVCVVCGVCARACVCVRERDRESFLAQAVHLCRICVESCAALVHVSSAWLS